MTSDYIKKSLFIIGKKRKYIPLIILGSLVVSLFDIIGLSLLGGFVASFVSDEGLTPRIFSYIEMLPVLSSSKIYNISLYIVLVYFFRASLSAAFNYFVMTFCAGLGAQKKVELIDKYYGLSFSAFLARKPAHYIYIVTGATEAFSGNILLNVFKIINDIIIACVIAILLAVTDWRLFSGFLIFFGLIFLLYDGSVKNTIYRLGIEMVNQSKALITQLSDVIKSYREIKILGKESYFADAVQKSSLDLARVQVLYGWLNSLPRLILELGLMTFFVTSISFYYEVGEPFPLSNFAIFAAGAFRAVPLISQLATSLSTIRHHNEQLQQLYEDISTLESPGNSSIAANCDKFHSIKFEKVSFAHGSGETRILENISFEIKRGDIVGLVGPSGSGKSTTLDMILGLLPPSEGRILLNGSKLEAHTDWGSLAYYLPQNSIILDGTYASNIALSDQIDDVMAKKILDVTKQAKLGGVAGTNDEALFSPLGNPDSRFSGGERQRVSIARALFANRQLVVLDESTSALDKSTQLSVIRNILASRDELTCIMVFHDESSLSHCSKILHLDAGQLTEYNSIQEYQNKKSNLN